MIDHIINVFKNIIIFGEVIGFHISKAFSKVFVYGIFMSGRLEAEQKAKNKEVEYNLKLENLKIKEKELAHTQKELDLLKEELTKIKGLGVSGKEVVKKLQKEVEQYKEELNAVKNDIENAQKLKKDYDVLKFQNSELKRFRDNYLVKADEREKSVDPLIDGYNIKIEALKRKIKELQEGQKAGGISLKDKIKTIEQPVFVKSYNPIKLLLNTLKYWKQKKEFEKAIKAVNYVEISTPIGKSKDNGMFRILSSNKKNRRFMPESIQEFDRHIKLNDKFVRIYYLANLPTVLTPYLLFRIIASGIPMQLSTFVTPWDSAELKKRAKDRRASLQVLQKKRMEQGKNPDEDIEKELKELDVFIEQITSQLERGFTFSMYASIIADSKKELLELHREFQTLVDQIEFTFNTYTFGQQEALECVLPLNDDRVHEDRVLQTSAILYLFPFLSAQLNDPSGIWFGYNKFNGSMVFIDVFKARNHNINIFGTSGSGKSYLTKLISKRLCLNGTQIMIIDIEKEYLKLCKAMGGEIISFDRDNGMNPFYVGSAEKDDILKHVSLLKTFFKFFIPNEKYDSAVLDDKLMNLYDTGEPTFKNFINLMKDTPMHSYLKVLDTGSLQGVFSSERQLNLNSHFIVFDLSSLHTDEVYTPAMMLLTSLIWNMINKADGKKRMLFIDEAHNLLVKKDVAEFYKRVVKQARKRKLGVVSVTQNIEDFTRSEEGIGILTNAETTILLGQKSSSLAEIEKAFQLPEKELNDLSSYSIGDALLFREKERVRMAVSSLPSEHSLITTG